jgi:hypothetical protein
MPDPLSSFEKDALLVLLISIEMPCNNSESMWDDSLWAFGCIVVSAVGEKFNLKDYREFFVGPSLRRTSFADCSLSC